MGLAKGVLSAKGGTALKLSHHVYLIIAIFAVVLAGLTAYYIHIGVNKDVDVAALEMEGDAYQSPLEKLLNHVSQHQLLAHRLLSGDKTVSAATVTAMAGQVNQDLGEL